MGYRFASRANVAEESGIRKMLGMASPGAINLSIGEPNFEPPANVRNALKRAVDENRSTYGPSAGLAELREAIARKLRGRWKAATKDNVVVTVGATEALYCISHVLYEQGDEVLLPDPGFFLYGGHVKLQGAVPVFYPLRKSNGYRPAEEDLKELITPKTRCIVVNSPSNPTGMALREPQVKLLADLAEDHDLVIISDEVYDELMFEGAHSSFLGAAEKVVYVNSFSKTYSTTGWRLGYLAADEEVAKRIERMTYHLIACPPTITQYSALEALKAETGDYVRKMVSEFRERRDLMVRGLNSIPGFDCPRPDGAIYVFPSFSFKLTSAELTMKILEKGVVVVPGSASGPGGEGHVRICLGARRADLEEALRRIASAVEGLR